MKVRKIEIPNMLLDCKNFHCFLKKFGKKANGNTKQD